MFHHILFYTGPYTVILISRSNSLWSQWEMGRAINGRIWSLLYHEQWQVRSDLQWYQCKSRMTWTAKKDLVHSCHFTHAGLHPAVVWFECLVECSEKHSFTANAQGFSAICLVNMLLFTSWNVFISLTVESEPKNEDMNNHAHEPERKTDFSHKQEQMKLLKGAAMS